MNHKEYTDLIDRACAARYVLDWVANNGSLVGIGPVCPHPSTAFDEYARTVHELIGVLVHYQSYILEEE